jgi:SAM-dependent methyltransferase
VLDVGAGSGRDLAVLLALGHDARGIEPNAAMRAIALRRHPALDGRLAPGALPDIGQPFGGAFDAVVCSAVLMHLSPAELVASLRAFAAVLAPAGRVLLSTPALPEASLRDGRDADQRRFTNHAPATIAADMRRLGFAAIGEWASEAGQTRWTVQLFERA